MNDWLIETALEATPPEHRTAVYQRMRSVADKAFEILMPDYHEDRRRLVGSLPERDMPLSAQEWCKTLEVVRRDAGGLAPVAGPPAEDASGVARPRFSAGCSELAGARRGASDEFYAAPTTPRADLGVPHTEPPVPLGAQVGEDPSVCPPTTPREDLGVPPDSHPPTEGIMSPKTHSATEQRATEPGESPFWVTRPRSSAGRGAPGEIGATSTTPRADLGVPPAPSAE
jgi:hypothetical protein